MRSQQRDAVDETVPGAPVELRDTALCWPDLAFDRERVIALGAPAHCWTADGALWEFETGVFFVTGLPGRERRRRVQNAASTPDSGWVHPPECACSACRVRRR